MTSYPQEAYCPITHQVMNNPWCDREGISYEKSAILEWLKKSSSSPVSRKPLSIDDLRPNLALKSIIDGLIVQDHPNVKHTKQDCSHLNLDPKAKIYSHENYVNLEIGYDDSQRIPVNLVLNVDLSYSMESPASKNNDVESQLFSVLALVKHSMKTIIKGLNENDYLAIVSFASTSKVEWYPLNMTEENKGKALLCIERMSPHGQTNFYSGISESYKCCREFPNDTIPTIMTFTDGQSNINPVSGLVNALEKFKNADVVKANMHVFGFGPDLDTDLLFKTSEMFNGRFDFISDFSMVGTVFVNALTNILMTVKSAAKLNIISPNNRILKVNGKPVKFHDIVMDAKDFTFGQNRTFLIEFESVVNHDINIMINLDSYCFKGILPIQDQKMVQRAKILSELGQVLRDTWVSRNPYTTISGFMNKAKASDIIHTTPLLKDIFEDLSTQLSMGASDKYYNDWGRKYIYAYYCSLSFQQCNNFKDKLASNFGSNNSKDLLSEIEKIYMNIPPPKTTQRQVISSNRFMSSTYNPYGGCVHHKTNVTVLDGSIENNVMVSCIRPGYNILTRNTKTNMFEYSKVEYVTAMQYKGDIVWYSDIIGITTWHPVWHDSSYTFPINDKRKLDTTNLSKVLVYNIVAENRGDIVLGDIYGTTICMISLGHKIINDNVAKHNYFGTDKVIKDLEEYKQTCNYSVFEISDVSRDENGLVNKLILGGRPFYSGSPSYDY